MNETKVTCNIKIKPSVKKWFLKLGKGKGPGGRDSVSAGIEEAYKNATTNKSK